MRAISVSLMLLSCVLAVVAGEPLTLSSRISEVTVYADRAEVTRVAKRSLSAGEQVVAFRGLPDQLDQNSIQVSGTGPAVLQDIRFERRQLDKTPHAKVEKLDDQIQTLSDSIRAIDDNMSHARREIEFIQSIANGLTRDNSKETPIELDPAKWTQMVTFYREKLDKLDREIRRDERTKRDVATTLDRVRRERNELAAGGNKVSNDVEVTLTVRKGGSVGLELTYIVYGPSWAPLYDVRVSSDTKKLELTYKAQVRQSTSEEWQNVTVKLSTASPQQGGQHPELQAWYLNYWTPRPMRSPRSRKRAAPAMSQMMKSMDAEMEELAAEPPAPMEVATAEVETRSTSVVFVPKGTTTIANDNLPSTVVVAVLNLPAHFRYSSVPKLSQYAYLKAKAKNDTEYPLLPGRANIFFDNAFVTTSNMELVAPTEEFWTFLGIDEAMAVEYKLLRRFEEEIGNKTKVTFEYHMEIQNNKKTAEEIVIWDQLPISSNEEIVVSPIEPELKENTDAIKKNSQNFVEWYFKLDPGKKAEIPFSFSVKYPEGRSVEGL